jgi:hypothetical protein
MISCNDAVEIRAGQPFCKQCGRLMSTIIVNEPAVYPPRESGKAYFCPVHGQTIVIDGVNSRAQI